MGLVETDCYKMFMPKYEQNIELKVGPSIIPAAFALHMHANTHTGAMYLNFLL